ncbi:MAG: ATP-binding protein [Calditrichaeota bacterium]|nr:ATP-binding protein [Calditrichota bacterium]
MMDINQIINLQLYPRDLSSEIAEWMGTDHILLITGSRQVGKTSLLYLLIQMLVKKGVQKERIYYFDLEDFSLLETFNEGRLSFERYLRALGENFERRIYVFIDEIQYMSNPTNFLKLVHDRYKNIKIICSGSSTLDIQRKFKDSLVGRKLVFELFPLSFTEFLSFKQQNKLLNILREYKITDWSAAQKLPDILPIFKQELVYFFDEYNRFGGYPAGVLEEDYNRKIVLINEIYQSYVRKDIKQLFAIENLPAFNKLIKLIGFQIGQLINVKELAASASAGWRTMEKYLFILENTFIIKLVPPFFANKRKEIVKMPKVFFHDNGLRNQIVKNLNPLESRADAGQLVENFIFQQLYRKLRVTDDLKFWRTLSKNEVDFVIESDEIVPIKVKYRTFHSPMAPKGMQTFIQKYNSKKAFVITKNYIGESTKQGCRIIFLPAYLFV